MHITNDVVYVGINDHKIDLFEGKYVVPNGMSYNSYVILDQKVAVMDSVDVGFGKEWLANLQAVLQDRQPDYLVVQHMEPDHSANVLAFVQRYPNAKVVATNKAFVMMKNFFGTDLAEKQLIVGDGDTLCLGNHTLTFVTAPMVHWPEVMMTYDQTDKILFSADAFGKFGALDVQQDWLDEARRYYVGIVGKYGAQVQAVLKKTSALQIEKICSLHGPVLDSNINYYLGKYDLWSKYQAEFSGVAIAYTSIYGNTKQAVDLLEAQLLAKGVAVEKFDLARCDMPQAVAKAFAYDKLVLATTTYNNDVFPFMKEFINNLTERNFANKHVTLIENGSWAPVANKVMKSMLEKCKNLKFGDCITIHSSMSDDNKNNIATLANSLAQK